MPTLNVNGTECHGHYCLAVKDDPTVGETGFYDYDELGTGIVQRLPDEDIVFVESPFWQAAKLLLSASGGVVNEG